MTPQEIVDRAETIWPLGTVEYSQENDTDCSAFVSKVLGITRRSTVTLVKPLGPLRPLLPGEVMQPGDFTGHMGPGTEGNNGHVQVVTDVYPDGGYGGIEQAGGGPGPTRFYSRFLPRDYATYRYDPEDDMTPDQAQQFDDLIWRIDALNAMSPTIRGGAYIGQPCEMVIAMNRLAQQSIQDRVQVSGDLTVTIKD